MTGYIGKLDVELDTKTCPLSCSNMQRQTVEPWVVEALAKSIEKHFPDLDKKSGLKSSTKTCKTKAKPNLGRPTTLRAPAERLSRFQG